MIKKFNPIEYKKRNITIWNEVASRYHKRWASTDAGPFESTNELIRRAKIKKGHEVLDIACGTGVVTKKISSVVGRSGFVVGIDTSSTAIHIAKKENHGKNLNLVLSDAENFHFNREFDVITCQYALFFFPNSKKVLTNARQFLKNSGILAISVHGKNVPFFSCILDVIRRHIPDYVPPGTPDLDRFGTEQALVNEVKKVGFSNIKVKEYVFQYTPGIFSDYWTNYLKYIAKPLKEKIGKLSPNDKKTIRNAIKTNTSAYTNNNGKIIFPWQVLILTAKK